MTGDLILGDNVMVEIGSASGGDLRLYHDASHSYVNNQGTGDLLIRGDDVKIQDAASGHNMGVFVEDGGVELYHNNVKKLETTAAGAHMNGSFRVSTHGNTPNVSNSGWQIDTAGYGYVSINDSNTNVPIMYWHRCGISGQGRSHIFLYGSTEVGYILVNSSSVSYTHLTLPTTPYV